MKHAHLRIARPTQDLDSIVEMYCAGLGFEKMGGFRGHKGYDGEMLGHATLPYHFEFTFEKGASQPTPSVEELLVFYVASSQEWAARCAMLLQAGFQQVRSQNPYWDVKGRTFVDIDGHRVVLQNSSWPPNAA